MCELLTEDGKRASLEDVTKWFNYIYNERTFVRHPIAMVRGLLNAIQNGDLKEESFRAPGQEIK